MLIRNRALLKIACFVLVAYTVSAYSSPGSDSKPAHDVAVTNVSMPSNCVAGDTIPVTISLANQGTQRETFRVILTEDTSGKEIASREVTLAKGWKDGSEDVADVVFNTEETGIQYFGNEIWSGGDINGDGLDDILISATGWNGNRGRVYLYYGGSSIDPSYPDITISGEDPNTLLGNYAGISTSDVNGDGYEDVIIGARGYHNNDGRVYVYYGGPAMDTQADMVFNGEIGKEDWFGLAVASADIDDDGYEDILVGAQNYDQGRGRVYLFWGGNPMDTAADLIFEGEAAGDWFGRKIDAGGDVNGDGYNEILIGARQWGNNHGRAYLYFGNRTGRIKAVSDHAFTGESHSNEMGASVEMFDIDNDGFDDVLVGARFAANWRGRVYIYWGSRDFDRGNPDVVLEGEPYSNMSGDNITCGYFNSDNYGDILVGGYNYPSYPIMNGRAYIFYGGTKTSMAQLADYIFEGESGHAARFGMMVSSGDYNDDNNDDVVIGAWGYNNSQGRAYLFYGPFSNTEDITFNWNTSNAKPGKHALRASIAPVEGEEDVADNTMTVTVEVKEASK